MGSIKKRILIFMIVALLGNSLLMTNNVSEASNTITTTIELFHDSDKFNPSGTKNVVVDLASYIPSGYQIKSYQVFKDVSDGSGGVRRTNKGTYGGNINANKLTFSSFEGAAVDVENIGFTSNMYFSLFRTNNKKQFIFRLPTGSYTVSPSSDSDCWVNGIAMCPGILTKDINGKNLPNNTVRDANGWGIAISDGVPGPNSYFYGSESVTKSQLKANSVEITSAKPRDFTNSIKTVSFGKETGNDNKGYLSVSANMTIDNPLGSLNGSELRYTYTTDTNWKAQTYIYGGEVQLTLEPKPVPNVPYVTCTCAADPATVTFNNNDVSVKSTLTAAVNQKGSLTVKNWTLYGRAVDGSQLTTLTSMFPGKDSISQEFRFTISKDKLAGVDRYTETWVMRARANFTNGTSAEQAIECTTTVAKLGATPTPTPSDPNVPTPSPTPKPLSVDIEFSPGFIYTGDEASIANYSKGWTDYTWEFSENLDPMLSRKDRFTYDDILFTTPGTYKATFNASNNETSGSDSAYLVVSDPVPVAVVTGITRWVEDRPLPQAYSWQNSYTPIAERGVTLDATKTELRYKKVGSSSYISGWPTKAPSELGEYSIEARVYDSDGRVSQWGTLILEVVPDEPPTVEVYAPENGYRDLDVTLFISGESPDGDQLTQLMIQERYDADDDGNFDDETWRTLYEGSYTLIYTTVYSNVGERQYRAVVTEDYGLTGESGLDQTDILNFGPIVNFEVYGITQQPDQGEGSGPPETSYTPESILRSWVSKQPYIGGELSKTIWKASNNTLSIKSTSLVPFAMRYPDLGNGLNGRSTYNLATDLAAKPAWSIPAGESVIPTILSGHRILTKSDYTYYVRNAKDGTLLSSFTIPSDAGESLGINWDAEELYFSVRDSSNTYMHHIRSYNLSGVLQKSFSITLIDSSFDQYRGRNGMEVSSELLDIAFSKDRSTAFITAKTTFRSYSFSNMGNSAMQNVHTIKFNLNQKTSYWQASYPDMNEEDTSMDAAQTTIGPNNEVYVSITYTESIFGNSQYQGSKIYLIDASGNVMGDYSFGYGYVSPPVLSDDGQYVYFNHYYLNFTRKEHGTELFTLKARNLSREYSKETSTSTRGIDEYKSVRNRKIYNIPIPMPSGDVYLKATGSRYYGIYTNLGREIDLIEGDRSSTTDFGALNFYLPNGEIVHAVVDTDKVRFTYLTGGNKSEFPITGIVDKNSPMSSPILPDGSIYFFSGSNVIPLLSQSSGSGYPKPIDDNTVQVIDENWSTLLYDPNDVIRNQKLEFNVSVNQSSNDKVIGAAIQIQNEKNMYAVEWSNSTLTLFKVVNGNKTVLNSISLARSYGTMYMMKIESLAGTLNVYINGTKRLTATDTTFTKGSAGIMSLGQQQVSFSGIKRTNYGNTIPEETYQTVLVEETIKYDKLFADTESDVRLAEEWTYNHDPNYFANPLGISLYNGKTYSSAISALDKPGLYTISYRAQDQPGMVAYRKWSETVSKELYVHRRPIAQPDVRFTGIVYADGAALDYNAYDSSYDPDVPDFLAEKLFRTRWADEASWRTGERILYNRPGVELIIQEQVKDIHGAWSFWAETRVYKDALPRVNQTKPKMVITSPNGTLNNPSVLRIDPTVVWKYSDAEDDLQEQYYLKFVYVDTGETALELTYPGADAALEIEGGTFDIGRKMSVQGRVYSKGVWSDDSNIVYYILNVPPTTYLTNYNGPDASHPVYTNNNRPVLNAFTVDPENQAITAIDYEVFRSADGTRVVDTNAAVSAPNYTTAALAEGLHYWRARANDGFVWGPYSSNGFFFVDTVKPADVDEKLVVEPTAVSVQFNPFSDPAPSSGHASRTFYLQKVNVDGSVTNIDLNADGAAEYSVPLPLSRQSNKVTGLIPGQEYRLTVLDYDVAGNEGHFAYIYFNTNRPPTGDFDWSPNPVYEGDRVTFRSTAGDPDGDTLAVSYELTSPTGAVKSFSYTVDGPSYPEKGPALMLNELGAWRMRMTVSDGIADPAIITKTVQVNPLKVSGYVLHTELWDQHRRSYNMKQTDNADSPRGYSVFWAGEKFVLKADTTLTGTLTEAERVEVQMGNYSTELAKSNPAGTSWEGAMWDAAYSDLPEGSLAFTFTAYYSNGTVKTVTVHVTIEGQTLEIAGVHRVQ